jgi:chromosome segregation ATPase
VLNDSLPMANELLKENELLNSRIGTYTKQSKLLADSLKEREQEIRSIKDVHRKELEDLELRLGEEKFQIIDLEGKLESLQAQLEEKEEQLAEKDRRIAEIEAKDYEKKYKSLILE